MLENMVSCTAQQDKIGPWPDVIEHGVMYCTATHYRALASCYRTWFCLLHISTIQGLCLMLNKMLSCTAQQNSTGSWSHVREYGAMYFKTTQYWALVQCYRTWCHVLHSNTIPGLRLMSQNIVSSTAQQHTTGPWFQVKEHGDMYFRATHNRALVML
jgi:hypothetical protein